VTTTILLSDPRVSAVPVRDTGEPLVLLPRDLAPSGQLVRASLALRLARADAGLPPGIRLRVVEGHRPPAAQRAIVAAYSAEVRLVHGDLPADELRRLTSRFVAPIEVAPHVAGAAVDLTLVDVCGDELDLGTSIDATPRAERRPLLLRRSRHRRRCPRSP
jgi:D-alanyl-D-alanine dipeptidase